MHMGRLNYRLSLSVSINTWRSRRHQAEVAKVSRAFDSLRGGFWGGLEILVNLLKILTIKTGKIKKEVFFFKKKKLICKN